MFSSWSHYLRKIALQSFLKKLALDLKKSDFLISITVSDRLRFVKKKREELLFITEKMTLGFILNLFL